VPDSVARSAAPLAALLPDKPIARNLLSSQIADVLRRDIYLGVIAAGTHLSQQQLTERFGTSRMPIRDALRALTHEGLLVTDPGRHLIVAPFSRDDLLDAYLVEGTLVGLAAERASRKATKDDIGRLSELHDAIKTASEAGDFKAVSDLNWQLHRSINRLAGSPKLLAAIKTVSVDLPHGFMVEVTDWVEHSNDDHELVLKAMREHKHARVKSLMTDHVVSSGERLISYLQTQGVQLD
jgi:DNA-binding GntR family transcriptional regulator